MANKAISELPQAENVNNQDLFVLEQGGLAKKLTAETFITEQGIIDALAEALDGHGGIQSVTLQSLSGRVRTYLITFSDGSATTFQVLDGSTITNIQKTSTAGLVDTYTVFMSDGTTTFFTVTNGADGTVSEAMLNDALKDKAPAVTETTESSAIANFTDGADDMVMHNIVAEIEPVQDLHGQANPWPAGGGANVWDEEWELGLLNTTTGETVPSSTQIRAKNLIPVQPNTTYYNFGYAKWTLPYGSDENVLSGAYMSQNTSNNASSIAGNSTFTTPANCYYIRFYLNPGYGPTYKNDQSINYPSTVTTYSPYSNICPITGWTGCNVTRVGKNLFDNSLLSRINNNVFRSSTFPLKAGSYIFSRPSADNSLYSWYVRSVQGSSFTNEATGGESVASKAFTLTEDSTMYLEFYKSSGIADNAIKNIQIEVGSTATAYEPYITPTTVSLSWQDEAGTVYGGTIDVATGLLTVTQKKAVFSGSESWNLSGSSFFYTQLSGDGHESALHLTENGVKLYWYGDSNQVRVYLSSNSFLTTSSNMHDYLDGIGFVYELATPQTYQLTGQQLKTLLGSNNVWADTGNVSVTYPADTKMFIEKLTMPTEDDLVANQAITSGKYFMIGNSLYLALANIASGAQITIGTNAQRVSLADALNAINS